MTTKPVTYGRPGEVARLLEGTAKVIEREPDLTFTDDDVRTSARHLARLLVLRLDGDVLDNTRG